MAILACVNENFEDNERLGFWQNEPLLRRKGLVT